MQPGHMHLEQKKLCFVGDNRNGVNWGRGASIALSQLLSRSFQISGRVMGDLFVLGPTGPGYVNTLIPPRFSGLFQRVLLNSHRPRILSWYVGLERLLGVRDFICEDPAESINNLLAHRHQYPVLEEIYKKSSTADAMVLDGDGDIIFSTPPRRTTLFLLAMIELGVRLKKPVFLVNSMISDCPLTGCNQKTLAAASSLFAQCRVVALRDPESLEYVREKMPAVKCCYIPDSLFAWHHYYADEKIQPPTNGDFFLPHPEHDEHWGKLDFSPALYRHWRWCRYGLCPTGEGPLKLLQRPRGSGEENWVAPSILPKLTFLMSSCGKLPGKRTSGSSRRTRQFLCAGSCWPGHVFSFPADIIPRFLRHWAELPASFSPLMRTRWAALKAGVLEQENPRQFSAFPDEAELVQIVAMARDYLDQGQTLRDRIKQTAQRRCEEVLQLPALIKSHLN